MDQTTRVTVGQAVTLQHVFLVNEDTPTDAAGDVTVTVKDPAGATVVSGTAVHGSTGTYTFVLPPQSAVTRLTVTWAATVGGFATSAAELVEVAGGVFFTIPYIRAADSQLADTEKYPTPVLVAARLETEIECEDICGRAFVPRYWQETLDGTGTSDVLLGRPDVRTILSAAASQRAGLPRVPFTEAELAALAVTSDGMLRRTDVAFWPEGVGNVDLGYVYGLDAPPQPLREAALVRLRALANKHRTMVPDRATSFTSVDGGTYRLTLPKRRSTGIPDVDAVYARYGLGAEDGSPGGSGGAPASRQLNYDPQYLSMFHGGVR
ncbi:hypothetical protein SAMN04489727_1724 [Amycolatopsis tolypomycina]|uniref:Uncharacterized protein n=1 Tax=Amycolatopsis tolypomycina TaxID=208445 RepID=A0A1H4JB45_9PSEU|nr:hypothetical protein [Amycolatopsis tolypomycina]SEB43559.1 hypothetical protein SAMN04489727_1724 [Amycolatopsis tolypomycina]